LGNAADVPLEAPTLQSLVGTLADVLGLDLNHITVTYDRTAADPAVQFRFTFSPDRLTFHQSLDFSAGVAGLKLQTGGGLDLSNAAAGTNGLSGSVTIKLADPDAATDSSGRITLGELRTPDNLSALFPSPDVHVDFALAGLSLSAGVGDSTLGTVTVGLPGG